MKVNLPEKKGHSPKNWFVEEFVQRYLLNNRLEELLAEDAMIPTLPTFFEDTIITVKYGITHGKQGAVLAEVLEKGVSYYLSFHIEFSTFKADKIKKLIVAKSLKENGTQSVN